MASQIWDNGDRMIRKESNKYVLYSKDGTRKLGEFDTRAEADEREREINAIKNAALLTVKTSLAKDGTMRWKATCSEATPDKVGESTSVELFKDWIERVETSKTVDWLPEPRIPFLGVSHYPALDGLGEAGPTEKMYINGKSFKADGTFYQDNKHPVGQIVFEAIRQDPDLIAKGQVDHEIKISAGWWDIAHRHGDFIFERKAITDKCPMCEKGETAGKVYLKGQLDHFAATRVPMHPNTEIGLEEKSMATRKEDAESIVGEELADKLEAAVNPKTEDKALVSKSEDDQLAEKAFTMDDAIAMKQARKLEDKVWTLFDMFMMVVENIQFMAESEDKPDLLVQATTDFGNMVADLRNNMPDVMAMMSTVQKSEVIMSDTQPTQEQQATTDVYATLKATVEQALANPQLSREQKFETIQPALTAVAETIKANVEQVTPVDTAQLVAEQVAKSMQPITEQLSLITAQLKGQAGQPVQKSFSPVQPVQVVDPSQHGLPVSPVTGQPSKLTSMIRKSVMTGQQ